MVVWTFDQEKYQKQILVPAIEEFIKSGGTTLPDVFERYALPLEVSDPTAIQQALKSVAAFWNKTKENSKFGSLLRVLLAEDKEKALELSDEKAREAVRELVKEERQKKQDARFAELDTVVKLGSSKGYLLPQERDALLSQFGVTGLAQSEILSRIKVPIEERTVKEPDEGLDSSTRKKIRTNLAVLKKPNLYAFFEISRGASKQELETRYQALSAEWSKRKPDHNKIAANALLSTVKDKLLNEGLQKYERALVWDAIDYQLRTQVEFAASDRRISLEEFEILVNHGTKYGIGRDHAIEAILWLAHQKGAIVEQPERAATVVCAGCYASVAQNNSKCTSCGQNLWTVCPRCKTKGAASDAACGNCGLVTADRHRVNLLVRKVHFALAEKNLEEALQFAHEAERIWGRDDDVALILSKVEALLVQVKVHRQNYDEALRERLLLAARSNLGLLASISSNHRGWDGKTPVQLQRELEAQIQKVEKLLEKARASEAERNANGAVCIYQEILSISRDVAEADEGLKRWPPEPPETVKARVYDGKIVVEWRPSPAIGNVDYLLVRCEDRAAVSAADGTSVAKLSSNSYCDEGVRAGSFVYYSVFTERGGVHSSGAVSEGVLAIKEVENFVLEVGDASVRGRWDFSATAGRVCVLCGSEASLRQGQGRAVQLINPHAFEDQELTNGNSYTYRVFVEYRHPNGKTGLTEGRYAAATPVAPPPPLARFEINPVAGELRFQWTPPPFGTVSIYKLSQKPEWECGTQISLASLTLLGVPLPNTRAGYAVDSAPSTSQVYYTPFSIAGDAAIVGQAQRFVAAEEISHLQAEDFSSYLLLRWKWSRSFQSVVVAWRHDDYPNGAQDAQTHQQKVTRGEYDANGGFRIHHPEARPYKFVVYTVTECDGQPLYSSGLNPDCRAEVRARPPVTIKYSLKVKGWRQKRIVVSLTCEETLTAFPELWMVAKRGQTQPLSSQEGTVIVRINEAQPQPQAPFEYEFEMPSLKRPFWLRMFFAAPDAYDNFKLLDPPPHQLRVR